MSVCDWWNNLTERRVQNQLRRMGYSVKNDELTTAEAEAVINLDNAKPGEVIFCTPDFYGKYKAASEPKPDTVESVLNQFIALGHDKPEVVIKGEIYHGGDARYKATIDGSKVYRRGAFVWLEHFDSIEQAEYTVTDSLRAILNKVPVEEIEITY